MDSPKSTMVNGSVLKHLNILNDIVHWVLINVLSFYEYINKHVLLYVNHHAKPRITKLFKRFDININGSNPWDIQVHDEQFYNKVASNLTLGMAESYMAGYFDCDQLDEVIYRLLRGNLYTKRSRTYKMLAYCLYQLQNRQTKERAYIVGQQHYDLGNDLYSKMLDPTMTYSCGYWKDANDLNEAQLNKLKLIGDKLKLEPGMTVLDIGCGWGGLCKYLAKNYHVKVTGITISVEQQKMAEESCSGLDVDIRLCDYRDINETFDRVVSVGMFEHVGEKNYETFFEIARKCLSYDGLLLLHTMGVNHYQFPVTDPFTDKYIFPNGMFPRLTCLVQSFEGKFILEDLQNFGADYYPTLMSWYENFENAWPELAPKYGDRFYKMWKFYLLFAAGLLKSRKVQVYHLVLSLNGLKSGYRAVR